MKDAKDLLPWKVTDISVYPYGTDRWSMNPSILLDSDGTWRCVARIVDYAMPGGITIRSPKSGPGHQTKNAMIILDPATWKPIQIFKMHERDDHPRTASANVGFEDMRIFKTDRGGLQGIAAALHLARDTHAAAGGAQHQPPEQVLLSFDDQYNIVKALPIRGDGWSGAQKNWAPYTDCVEPRFLYSIGKSALFDDRGPVHGDAATVRSNARAAEPVVTAPTEVTPSAGPKSVVHEVVEQDREQQQEKERRPKKEKKPDLRAQLGGASASLTRGMRRSHDTVTSRPAYTAQSSTTLRRGGRVNTETARTLGTGRILLPKYAGLRGGTQLVRVGNDAWLGIGHEMRFDKGLKYYWHTFFMTDARGKMTSVSPPCKLAPEGIEFAAGMAIESDRVVISFGVDDMHCRLGETSLAAVLGILRPVEG